MPIDGSTFDPGGNVCDVFCCQYAYTIDIPHDFNVGCLNNIHVWVKYIAFVKGTHVDSNRV